MKHSMPICYFPVDGTVVCGEPAPCMITVDATNRSQWPERSEVIYMSIPVCTKHADEISKIRQGVKVR